MPATTPNVAIPYPLGSDPIAAEQLQDVAEALDSLVGGVDAQVRALSGRSTTNVDLTGTIVDVPGTAVSFVTNHPNALLVVFAVFDLEYNNTTGQEGNHNLGYLNVDGTDQSPQVVRRTTANARATVAGTWNVTLAAATSHTVKLRTRSTREAGSADCNPIHTGWSGLLFDG